MQNIEYKLNDRYSVYFMPIENNKCEYRIEIHDFYDLSCYTDIVNYIELELILKGIHESII